MLEILIKKIYIEKLKFDFNKRLKYFKVFMTFLKLENILFFFCMASRKLGNLIVQFCNLHQSEFIIIYGWHVCE